MSVPTDKTHPNAVWIEIIIQPHGDAPDAVRACWIGLRLYAPFGLQHQIPVTSVLKQGFLRRLWSRLRGQHGVWDGYLVNASDAVKRLSKRHPDAALWWHENAPELLTGEQALFFNAACCVDLGPPIYANPNTANHDNPPPETSS